MRSISEHLQSLWLAITLSAIPHGALGGDSPPVPSSPAPPMHPSASANTDASAPFTLPAPLRREGISHDTLKGAWEGQACECFQVGQAWEQAGNYKRAAKWYRLSAEQGYALAQANLAMLYERNRVMPDSALANKPVNRLAEQRGQRDFVHGGQVAGGDGPGRRRGDAVGRQRGRWRFVAAVIAAHPLDLGR